MATVSVRLRFPTKGHKRSDVIEVEKSEAERLVANGSAVVVKAEKPAKD